MKHATNLPDYRTTNSLFYYQLYSVCGHDAKPPGPNVLGCAPWQDKGKNKKNKKKEKNK